MLVTATAATPVEITRSRWSQATIEGRQLLDGPSGPITTQLRQAYWDAQDDAGWSTPIAYEAT